MLISVDDLNRFTAKAEDASFSIRDAFLSLSSKQLSYLVIDTGSWFESDTVLVAASVISDVSTDDRTITLSISESDIRAAPAWEDDDAQPSLAAVPPIVVGPFGGAISPLMMASLAPRPNKTSRAADDMTQTLDQFSRLINMDVFGSDGQLGSLIDFLFDPETCEIKHLVIDNGKVLSGRQLIVPIERLEYKAQQETHLVMNLTSSQLAEAPQLEESDRLDRNWVDVLRSYYRLPV